MAFPLAFLVVVLSATVFFSDAARLTSSQKLSILATHNAVRCRTSPKPISMPALVWDSKLESVAQRWADTCSTSHNPNRSAWYGTGYVGENLAWGYSSFETAITSGWESEKAYYSISTNLCASGHQCGHYTQLVWANTGKVGCATPSQNCPTWGSKLYVCNYAPGGNIVGSFPYIVGSGSNAACSASNTLGVELNQGALLEGAGVPSEEVFFDENMPISAASSPLSGSRAVYILSCATMIALTVLVAVVVHFKRIKAVKADTGGKLSVSADENLAVVVIEGTQQLKHQAGLQTAAPDTQRHESDA
jgi:hypothetical protein